MNDVDQVRPTGAWRALGIGVIFGLVVGWFASARAESLHPGWPLDIAYIENIVWNLAHGNGYVQTVHFHELPGLFGDSHFRPILLLAVLPYRLVSQLETLLVLQAALVGLGAFAVHRLGLALGASRRAATLMAVGWVLWWPLWRMAVTDIRTITWATPFLVLCTAALVRRRAVEAVVWALIACTCREEVAAVVVGLGGGSLLSSWLGPQVVRRFRRLNPLPDGVGGAPEPGSVPRGRRNLTAVLVVGAAVAWTVGSWMLRAEPSNYVIRIDWIADLLGQPPVPPSTDASLLHLAESRLSWMSTWLAPVGLGALAAPEIAIGAILPLIFLFGTGDNWAAWDSTGVHWLAPSIAVIAAASAVGWWRVTRWLGRTRPHAARAVVIGVLGAELVLLGAAVNTVLFPEIRLSVQGMTGPPMPESASGLSALHDLVDRVPPDAVIAADYETVHLLGGRAAVYCFSNEPDVGPPEPGIFLPRAGSSLTHALINRGHEDWTARAVQAGMVPVDEAWNYVLYRQPAEGGPRGGSASQSTTPTSAESK